MKPACLDMECLFQHLEGMMTLGIASVAVLLIKLRTFVGAGVDWCYFTFYSTVGAKYKWNIENLKIWPKSHENVV